MSRLSDRRVAFLVTDGFEDSELTSPWDAVAEAGGTPVLIAPTLDPVTGALGHQQTVDVRVADAKATDFDALVLPGGVQNADALRMDSDAVAFTKDMFAQHKPAAAICHGAWLLVEADVVRGRTLTSYPSLRTDLENAGATWVDEAVRVDQGLVSSRTPDDLPDFNRKLVEEIGEGKHSGQHA